MRVGLHIIFTSFQKAPLFLLAAGLACISFFVQGYIGLNLWDEGFLWYGAQRVVLGEVPIRDFMAYDPGRYYWAAAIMSIVGDNGIISLRISSLILQVLALFVALNLISKTQKPQNPLFISIYAITLLMWMFLSYKMVDYAASIFLVAALAFLIENPTVKRYFILGTCVGLAAFFGRNHGVYGVIASLGAIFWLVYKHHQGCETLKGLAFWAAGIVLGFMPMFLMIIFVPGFAQAFWQSILILFQTKATNITVPIPWPWLIEFSTLPTKSYLRAMLIGIFFVALIAFGILGSLYAFWCKYNNKYVSPIFVASALFALPYAHYAYSRADIHHLSFAIYPMLIGSFTLLASQKRMLKWSQLILLSIVSVLVTYAYNPGWECQTTNCESITVSGSKVWVSPAVAKDVALIEHLAETYARGQSVLIAPFWPGAYSLLNRKSPMWDIYALLPRDAIYESAEIARIKHEQVKMVLITDIPLDGSEDYFFKQTHPMIYRYIVDNFDKLTSLSNPSYHIYILKRFTK